MRLTIIRSWAEPHPNPHQRRSYETAAKSVFPVNEKGGYKLFVPYSISGDSLLYLKASLNKRPAFYIKDKDGNICCG
jgi:hypothetical protein